MSVNNEDECVGDYLCLLATNGFLSTLHSNGISYEEFRTGFYVAGFDLTTSQEGAGDPLSIPSVRLGTAWYNKIYLQSHLLIANLFHTCILIFLLIYKRLLSW